MISMEGLEIIKIFDMIVSQPSMFRGCFVDNYLIMFLKEHRCNFEESFKFSMETLKIIKVHTTQYNYIRAFLRG